MTMTIYREDDDAEGIINLRPVNPEEARKHGHNSIPSETETEDQRAKARQDEEARSRGGR